MFDSLAYSQEVIVDGSISEEPERVRRGSVICAVHTYHSCRQSDDNSNGSGSSKSSTAASKAAATGTSSTLSKLFKG